MRGITEERLIEILNSHADYERLEFILLSECKELNSWQLIDENTPKDRRVLLFYPDIKQQFAGAWSINHRSFDTQTIIFGRGEPTHWQELPKNPE